MSISASESSLHRGRAGRLAGIEISDIVRIKARAAALRAEGRDIIDLSIGEPDFDTPLHICEAAALAMARGETHYTATSGTTALREAILRKIQRDNGQIRSLGEVFVGVGAKQVISCALLATLEPGDEVVLAAPFWSNYADMVRLAGGRPVIADCPAGEGFKLSAERLRETLSPRTRWLILNSPSNPTGAVLGRSDLAALAEVIAENPRLLVVEDAIYEPLLFDRRAYASLLDVAPSLAARTLWVNGVSKAYAMTGWRIGYGVGPDWLADAMSVVAAQTTSHPCSVAQAAAVAALDGPQTAVEAFRKTFEARRDIVSSALRAVPGLVLEPPAGAFYAFPAVGGLLGDEALDDIALAQHFLTRAGVAMVPGSAFGAPGHLRLSFAAATPLIVEACDRIQAACRELR